MYSSAACGTLDNHTMEPDGDLNIVIIAHPDDESMFFVPTIRALKTANKKVWILCLTTGDFDGRGRTREKELYGAGRILGVDKVIVRDELKDHPTERWDTGQVEKEIKETLEAELCADSQVWKRVVLITFDQYGVSGHVNHIDTFKGIREVVKTGGLDLRKGNHSKSGGSRIPVEAWQLVSERNTLRKYLPVVSWVILILSFFLSMEANTHTTDKTKMYRLNSPQLNWSAMNAHKSQFVWYRRLFVVFSCYTYINALKPIPILASIDQKSRN